MSSGDIGYWPSRWPSEDGGGERKQLPLSGKGLNLKPGDDARVVSREVIAATMAVLREPGEIYLLRHTAGDERRRGDRVRHRGRRRDFLG